MPWMIFLLSYNATHSLSYFPIQAELSSDVCIPFREVLRRIVQLDLDFEDHPAQAMQAVCV